MLNFRSPIKAVFVFASAFFLCAQLLSGCSESSGGGDATTDQGDSTAGSSDAGTADAGGSDAGTADAGTTAGVAPPNDSTPIVRAPADQQIALGEPLVLSGSVAIPGAPVDIPVVYWEQVSGPGVTVFNSPDKASTTVNFDTVGTYLLQLTVANGPFTANDQVNVVVVEQSGNLAPVVDVGADENTFVDVVLNLAATVTDDGLPNGVLTGEWTKTAGPGTATFGDISSTNTTVTFSASGDYTLRYTATDGDASSSDELSVLAENAGPPVNNNATVNANNQWQVVTTKNGTKPEARHEAAAVAYQNKLYLIGGRGKRQLNRYNPATNSWENLGTPAASLHHIQPVVYNGKIYLLGSLDCCFPRESVVAKIQIFNPANNKWTQGASLPVNRRRGSAGVVVYQNKIYMVGGSTNGHDGGMVNWFDEYNPATNQWKTLPNAPTKRDHFSAALVGNELIATGGRATDHPATFANLVGATDIYNFSTGKWRSGKPIPTRRAGAMTVSYGSEVVLMGGEANGSAKALNTVEAYNVKTNQWRTLNSLKLGRHSGGAAIINGAIHVVSGNITIGGGHETQSHEKLELD